jgi:Uma2 family endonuclease
MESTPGLTYEDYCQSKGEGRWELIAGEPFSMSPAPTPVHQRIVRKLAVALTDGLQGGTCEVFVSPIDVKFSNHDVVQPDLVVVCDPNQIADRGIEGAPSLVIEVVSPSSLRHDRIRKFNLYAKYGIGEYWIVSPYPAMLEVFSLSGEEYRAAAMLSDLDAIHSPAFPQLKFPLTDIFGPISEVPGEVKQGLPADYLVRR